MPREDLPSVHNGSVTVSAPTLAHPGPGSELSPHRGPEGLALESARRWSVLILAIVGLGLETVSVITVWGQLPALQRGVIVVAVVTAIIAAAFRKTTAALWIFTIAALLLALANLLPAAGVPWLHLNAVVLFVAFTLAMLVRPVYALVSAIVLPVVTHIVWETSPEDVIATGYAAWGGWIPPIQVAVMILLVNTVWWRLVHFARRMDAQYDNEQAQLQRSLEEQERQAARRRAAIAIHESLLNGIRSALTMQRVDAARLGHSLPPLAVPGTEMSDLTDAQALGTAIMDSAGVPIALTRSGTDSRSLGAKAFEALRGAVVEIVRNEVRHGTNPVPEVLIDTTERSLTITCSGQVFIAEPLSSGIGVRTAVVDSLRDVGASLDELDGRVMITLATESDTRPRSPSDSIFSRSRALMTAGLAAMASSGVLYFAAIITDGGWTLSVGAATAAAAAAGVAIVTLTLTAARVRVSLALAIVAAPAAVPWLLALSASAVCTSTPEITASAVNVTGFAVIGISLWSRWWVMLVGLGAWLGGMAFFVVTAPTSCAPLLLQPIANSLVVIPLFVAGTLLAARVYSQAAAQRTALELAILQERIAADAQAETNARLGSLVRGVTDELTQVSEGRTVDAAMEHRLRLYEGRIRAAVQVDPVVSGSFDRLAASVVEEMAATDTPVEVKLLEASADARPLPSDIHEVLTRATSGGRAVIAAFSDGESDYLTVVAPLPDVPWATSSADLVFDDVDLLIDEAATPDDPRGGRLFMARRSVAL